MIHYQLQCSAAHDFDGWFRDSLAYEEQSASGLVECPVCGERQVARALMAPAIPRKGRRSGKGKATPSPATEAPAGSESASQILATRRSAQASAAQGSGPPAPVAVGGDGMPDQVRAMLQKLRAEVERNCDYVGDDFAAEARRIHDGQSEKRGIYGEATEAQAEALADDGIEVGRIPWIPRADS